MSPRRKPKLRPKLNTKAPSEPKGANIRPLRLVEPRKPSSGGEMATISELREYIRSEGFNVFFGRSRGIEGDMIWCEGGKYCYGYSERGSISVIESSSDERTFVRAMVKRLGSAKASNPLALMEIVAWTWNEQEILSAAQELTAMGVGFARNDIPNFDGRYAYRIFAYRKDKAKIPVSFYDKYMKR